MIKISPERAVRAPITILTILIIVSTKERPPKHIKTSPKIEITTSVVEYFDFSWYVIFSVNVPKIIIKPATIKI